MLTIPFSSVKAVSSDSVNYKVNKYYVNSEIEIAGGLRVRQIIEVEGTFNGYYLNLSMNNNNVVNFTGKKSDLKGSSIYNPTSIENLKIGKVDNEENITIDALITDTFQSKIEYFETSTSPKSGYKNVYSINKKEDGNTEIKMYNETIKGKTIFYLEYTITNVLVEHNDSAEFYFNFLSLDYKDTIKDAEFLVALPYPSEKLFKVWAHGQRDASVQKDSENRGVIAYISNYKVGLGVDIRILFDKELFMININKNKKSGMDAIPIIEKIESERAAEANRYRKMDMIYFYGMCGIEIIYIISIICLTIYIYIKYDKEEKSSFKGKYYREFIEDYPVEIVDYLMNKTISSNAFSASILNLIYKKNMKVEEIKNCKKEDYKFIKIKDDKLSSNEKIIINLLFNKIGNGNEVLLSEIKNSSKKITSKGKNILYDEFINWKTNVIEEAIKKEFFIDNQKLKLSFILLGILGVGIFLMDNLLNLTILRWITLPLTIIFVIYIIIFTKRTKSGNEDYNKWKGFKNFLNDFGRFKEKELPEIILWERYLVYATVFGIAEKLQKTMKVKFEIISPDSNITFLDVYMFNRISTNISNGITSSINTSYAKVSEYKSNNWSSGSGQGGGFSSGGGFGGGGGASGGGF